MRLCAQTPSVGLIVIGVFTTLGTLVGCVGAIRQRRKYLYAFSCGMIIIMILQLGFGAAAGAVASGNAPEITGPAFGKIRSVSFRSCRLLADDPP